MAMCNEHKKKKERVLIWAISLRWRGEKKNWKGGTRTLNKNQIGNIGKSKQINIWKQSLNKKISTKTLINWCFMRKGVITVNEWL